MEESSFYQEIFEKGVQRGFQRGFQQGFQQGLQQALQFPMSMILRQLRRLVGDIAPSTEERIRALSITQWEDLAEALLDFASPADLTAWLDNLN